MIKKIISAIAFASLLSIGCNSGDNKTTNNNEDSLKQRIKANQIGYTTNSVKIAIIPDSTAEYFEIYDIQNDKVVYKEKTTEAKEWQYSGTKVKIADFTKVNNQGVFIVRCQGANDSYPFAIGEGIYDDLANKAVKSFYYARTAEEIKKEFAGKYARPAAHPDTQVIIHQSAAGPKRKAGDIISSPGGWYDAGDYNKYIVNSSITVFEMLNACENYPEYIAKMKTNIPESTNQLPDIIDEILINLRWMLTMQDPADGGVYHKLTALNFNGMIMPQEDKDERYVVMKTTSATLDLASTCAKAYRVLAKYDKLLPGFRDSLLTTAKNAWKWAQKNPKILYQQPKDVQTGTYQDDKINDEWVWASLEMFLSTGDKSYLKTINTNELAITTPCWDSTATLGVISLLTNKINSATMDEQMYNSIKDKFIEYANKLYNSYENSAYKTPLNVFPWGSNSEAANEGIVLLTAYKTTGDSKYLEAAQADLHYILGRNPLDYCMVTGFGSNGVKNIHDRRSVADSIKLPVAGLLCGGPFAQAGSDCGEENYPDKHPAMRYFDDSRSYSTNEIAINWNAALVMLTIGIANE